MVFQPLNITAQREAYFPLLQQLHPALTDDSFDAVIEEMQRRGYRLVGLFDNEQLVAVAGFDISYNLYDGKHLYLYDLVSDERIRSKGYGQAFIDYLEQLAREEQCTRIVLCSKFARVDAIRFYTEKLTFEKTKYVIEKKL